jgi:hypothetical protein
MLGRRLGFAFTVLVGGYCLEERLASAPAENLAIAP